MDGRNLALRYGQLQSLVDRHALVFTNREGNVNNAVFILSAHVFHFGHDALTELFKIVSAISVVSKYGQPFVSARRIRAYRVCKVSPDEPSFCFVGLTDAKNQAV